MSKTIGELNARVFLDLDLAKEYCDIIDVHRAVTSRLNVRLGFARAGSDTNVRLKTSSEFTPTALQHDITALIGNGTPAWLEMQDTADDFFPVRIVNYSQLADFMNNGIMAAAFWAEDADVNSANEPVQYVSFSYLPTGACRIKYDLDEEKLLVAQVSALPDGIAELIVLEAVNSLIQKKIKPKMAVDLRGNEELRKDYREIVAALDGMFAQNLLEIRDLNALFIDWAFRSRDVQTSFNKPTPSGRNLYGDGINY